MSKVRMTGVFFIVRFYLQPHLLGFVWNKIINGQRITAAHIRRLN